MKCFAEVWPALEAAVCAGESPRALCERAFEAGRLAALLETERQLRETGVMFNAAGGSVPAGVKKRAPTGAACGFSFIR